MEVLNCPHLGIIEDPGSYLSFPSEANHCLKLGAKTLVSLEHQAEYCLSSQFSSCPYFANGVSELEINNEKTLKKSHLKIHYTPYIALSALVLIMVLGYITGSSYLTRLFASDMELAVNSSELIHSSPEQDQVNLEDRTLTETAVQSYALSNHCPPPDNWIYYFVKPGDNVSAIAEDNGITIDQLLKVNCLNRVEDISPGSMIFIPTEKGMISKIEESSSPTSTSIPTHTPTQTSSITITPMPTSTVTMEPTTVIVIPTKAPTKDVYPTNLPKPPDTNPPRPTQPPPDRP